MALRQVVAFGLLLALAFSVECSTDEQSNIKVNVVPSMAEFLKENPETEFTPLELVEETTQTDASVSPYITRTYRIGYRVAGKIINIWTQKNLRESEIYLMLEWM